MLKGSRWPHWTYDGHGRSFYVEDLDIERPPGWQVLYSNLGTHIDTRKPTSKDANLSRNFVKNQRMGLPWYIVISIDIYIMYECTLTVEGKRYWSEVSHIWRCITTSLLYLLAIFRLRLENHMFGCSNKPMCIDVFFPSQLVTRIFRASFVENHINETIIKPNWIPLEYIQIPWKSLISCWFSFPLEGFSFRSWSQEPAAAASANRPSIGVVPPGEEGEEPRTAGEKKHGSRNAAFFRDLFNGFHNFMD